MTHLFYEILIVEEGEAREDALFRKASELPFPSPLGTRYDVAPLHEELVVCGYTDKYYDNERVLVMHLAKENCSQMGERVKSLAETRADLLDDCWDELDEYEDSIIHD